GRKIVDGDAGRRGGYVPAALAFPRLSAAPQRLGQLPKQGAAVGAERVESAGQHQLLGFFGGQRRNSAAKVGQRRKRSVAPRGEDGRQRFLAQRPHLAQADANGGTQAGVRPAAVARCAVGRRRLSEVFDRKV